mmetsp:Transcript_41005/g.80893  ORF Transcript_41005/g.80893 Transcript_41005/m.80893 type:complete len:200 (+) Transcript_41005:1329-1928(+)
MPPFRVPICAQVEARQRSQSTAGASSMQGRKAGRQAGRARTSTQRHNKNETKRNGQRISWTNHRNTLSQRLIRKRPPGQPPARNDHACMQDESTSWNEHRQTVGSFLLFPLSSFASLLLTSRLRRQTDSDRQTNTDRQASTQKQTSISLGFNSSIHSCGQSFTRSHSFTHIMVWFSRSFHKTLSEEAKFKQKKKLEKAL